MSIRSDNSFYCFICNEITTSEERRYNHFEKHIDYIRFKCLECDSKFTSYNDLECHQEYSKHLNFQKTTNSSIRKLINSWMELSLKTECSSDMDNVEFSVTFKTEKSKVSDSESTISNDSGGDAFDTDDSEDEPFISNVKSEVINSITVKSCYDPKNKNSNDSWRFSSSNNTLNGGKNPYKLIKMKQPEYLCMKTLRIKRFRINNNIINRCLRCNRIFGSARKKIEHILKDHMKLRGFKILQCMYCLNQEGKSKKFLDISSLQDHYRDVHKFPKRGCPINLALDYKGEEDYIHVIGGVDILAQYETQFVNCFINKLAKKNKYSRI